MTETRCPLVREIEEAARAVVGSYNPSAYAPAAWQRMLNLWLVANSPVWPRIRAALEAAEEMAQFSEQQGTALAVFMCEIVDRYREATSKP
jgi:hypothetical protein